MLSACAYQAGLADLAFSSVTGILLLSSGKARRRGGQQTHQSLGILCWCAAAGCRMNGDQSGFRPNSVTESPEYAEGKPLTLNPIHDENGIWWEVRCDCKLKVASVFETECTPEFIDTDGYYESVDWEEDEHSYNSQRSKI